MLLPIVHLVEGIAEEAEIQVRRWNAQFPGSDLPSAAVNMSASVSFRDATYPSAVCSAAGPSSGRPAHLSIFLPQ